MTRMPKEFEFKFEGCYIAGGAILSLATKNDIADYDVYPKNLQGLTNAVYELMNDFSSHIVNISDRAITFRVNDSKNRNGERNIVQIMTFDWFPTAESIFDFFDYTVCMGAFDCDSKQYVFHPDFYPDIASKTLRFNPKTHYPLASLLRTTKYRAKGFHIGKFEFTKIAMAVANGGLPNSWSELEASLGGVYGKQITLNVDDREYSYDAALEVLSNLDFDPEIYMRGEGDTQYSDLKDTDITNYFVEEELDYIEVNDHINCFVNGFFIGERFSTHLTNASGPRKFTKVTPTRMFGYISEGVSSANYKVGGKYKSTWSSVTHVSRSKSNIKNKNNKHFLISFPSDNITNVTYDKVSFSGEGKIEMEVSLETSATDDVDTVLEDLIHA